MSTQFDLVIRGGDIADGLGGETYRADVAVRDGRIVEVGQVAGHGVEEIDARGHLVTPGFVDIHTHYDAQAMWDNSLAPSSNHGVTTVVMGNCGVGFAPVREGDREVLIELMEGVEDIPGVALHEGLDWQWESFDDFLAALESRPRDIDCCAQLPHAALRLYVMGERAVRLEMATVEDMARMRELAAAAMRAGAIGFSTSRSLNHKSVKGDPTPSLRAAEEELIAIALGLKDAGSGVLQVITDFLDVESEFALLRRLVEVSGRPLSFSLAQRHSAPDDWRRVLELTAEAVRDGLPMRAQIAPRGVGVLLGLKGSLNVFCECPGYKEIAHLPLDERVARMREPQLRERLLAEVDESRHALLGPKLHDYANLYRVGNPPNYNPGREAAVSAIAEREGREAKAMAYDLLLEDDGGNFLYMPMANYAARDLECCAEMIADPNTVIGLGDGGAHVGLICDSSFPTFLLQHWGKNSGRFSLPWLVKRQTADTARAAGLLDRGIIAVGMKADLNVIAVDQLGLEVPHIQHDLPAGGKRLLQGASGYVATIVSGVPVYRDGEPTGQYPGRLVRI
ncbi:D-aminoacylase [compost metagenome]